jgi:hypothetical protein
MHSGNLPPSNATRTSLSVGRLQKQCLQYTPLLSELELSGRVAYNLSVWPLLEINR